MIKINGDNLTIQEVKSCAREREEVELTAEAEEKIVKSRKQVEDLIENKSVVYGITTGFGHFSDTKISPQEVLQLQENLIRSHSAGVGKAIPEEVVRAMMLLRLNALVKGYSGIRLSTINLLKNMLNCGIHPLIPSQGSVGASGDLVPLAHMSLVLMGEGKANFKGEELAGKEALAKCNLKPIQLLGKEGLALINGTQMMSAYGSLALADAINLMLHADISLTLTLEALKGLLDPFNNLVHEVRPHPGQQQVAKNVRKLVANSSLVLTKREDRVQDPYTLRCAPQVHGASYDSIKHVQEVIIREINSASDNPLLFAEAEEVISGGNFHGQPLALSLDYLALALAELGNISERRIARLVDGNLNFGLPMFLTEHGGLNSGHMIAQYTAASLVSENKLLANSASVDSITTSANQEDHVSMGSISARKVYQLVKNLTNILAIEFLTAAQAVDLRTANPQSDLGRGTAIVYKVIRDNIDYLGQDRVLAPDIAALAALIEQGTVVNSLEKEGIKLETC